MKAVVLLLVLVACTAAIPTPEPNYWEGKPTALNSRSNSPWKHLPVVRVNTVGHPFVYPLTYHSGYPLSNYAGFPLTYPYAYNPYLHLVAKSVEEHASDEEVN